MKPITVKHKRETATDKEWEFTCSNCGKTQIVRTSFTPRTSLDKETTKSINTSVYCDDCDTVETVDFSKIERFKEYDWLKEENEPISNFRK